jgi:hypothetical protein
LGSGNELWNEGKQVAVANGVLIEVSVVLHGPKFSIFFFDKEEGGGIAAL